MLYARPSAVAGDQLLKSRRKIRSPGADSLVAHATAWWHQAHTVRLGIVVNICSVCFPNLSSIASLYVNRSKEDVIFASWFTCKYSSTQMTCAPIESAENLDVHLLTLYFVCAKIVG